MARRASTLTHKVARGYSKAVTSKGSIPPLGHCSLCMIHICEVRRRLQATSRYKSLPVCTAMNNDIYSYQARKSLVNAACHCYQLLDQFMRGCPLYHCSLTSINRLQCSVQTTFKQQTLSQTRALGSVFSF